ncbi:RES family NAD+ phosphorylase [Duganella vulcania]
MLLVPSVIVPEEYNVLINPLHPDTSRITAQVLRQFIYDPRLDT